jgi:hypothetical protein
MGASAADRKDDITGAFALSICWEDEWRDASQTMIVPTERDGKYGCPFPEKQREKTRDTWFDFSLNGQALPRRRFKTIRVYTTN